LGLKLPAVPPSDAQQKIRRLLRDRRRVLRPLRTARFLRKLREPDAEVTSGAYRTSAPLNFSGSYPKFGHGAPKMASGRRGRVRFRPSSSLPCCPTKNPKEAILRNAAAILDLANRLMASERLVVNYKDDNESSKANTDQRS
jgi:hypothetical protein